MDMTIAYGAGMFTAIILALVLVSLVARSRSSTVRENGGSWSSCPGCRTSRGQRT